MEKLIEILLLTDQIILELFESEKSAHFRLIKARLDPSDNTLGLIPCSYEVSMRGGVRILLPGPIRPVPLLYSIRTRAIEPFGRGCGFSVTRNATLHSSHDNSGY